jgi:hypothetical protein
MMHITEPDAIGNTEIITGSHNQYLRDTRITLVTHMFTSCIPRMISYMSKQWGYLHETFYKTRDLRLESVMQQKTEDVWETGKD